MRHFLAGLAVNKVRVNPDLYDPFLHIGRVGVAFCCRHVNVKLLRLTSG